MWPFALWGKKIFILERKKRKKKKKKMKSGGVRHDFYPIFIQFLTFVLKLLSGGPSQRLS